MISVSSVRATLKNKENQRGPGMTNTEYDRVAALFQFASLSLIMPLFFLFCSHHHSSEVIDFEASVSSSPDDTPCNKPINVQKE